MLIHNIKHFFTIKTKTEQAINFILKIFYYYDPLYYNKLKGTSNKSASEIFSFV